MEELPEYIDSHEVKALSSMSVLKEMEETF